MNFGERKMQMSSDGAARDEDLAHGSAAAVCAWSASATASRPTPRERLDEHGVARLDQPGTSAAASAASATACVSPPNAGPSRRRAAPTVTSTSTPRSRGVGADLLVEAALAGPELEHVAEHRDAAPARGGRGELVQCRPHRHRVGVVAVVDDDDAARQLDPLAAQAPRTRPRSRPSAVDADARAAASAASALRDHVGLAERQLERRPARRRGERHAAVRRHEQAHVAARRRRSPSRRRSGGAARAAARRRGRPRCRPARSPAISSAFAAAIASSVPEQLEVHRADVHDHADVGLGDRGELGDLAGAAHRHLEHEHLGARAARRGSSAAGRSRC